VQTKKHRLNKKITEEGEAADREIRRLKNYLSQAANAQLSFAAFTGMEAAADFTAAEGASVSAEQISLSEPAAF